MIAASIYVKYLRGKKKPFLFFKLYSFPDNTMFFPFTTHLYFMSLQPVHFYQDRSRIVLGLVKTHTAHDAHGLVFPGPVDHQESWLLLLNSSQMT